MPRCNAACAGLVLSLDEGHDGGAAVQVLSQVEAIQVSESITGEFTVSHLVQGWDDVRLLATTDPDQVWEVVWAWPPQRVAAVTVLWPNEAMAAERGPVGANEVATGHRSTVSDAGQVAGRVAALEWPQ